MPALQGLLHPIGIDAKKGRDLANRDLAVAYADRVVVFPLGHEPARHGDLMGKFDSMTAAYNWYKDPRHKAVAKSWMERRNIKPKEAPPKGDAEGGTRPNAPESPSSGDGKPKPGPKRTGLEGQIEKIVSECLEDGVEFEIGEAEDSLKEIKKELDEAKAELEEIKQDVKPVIVELREPGEVPKKLDGIHHPMFPVLLEYVNRGHRCLAVGPSGSGKTYGAEMVAKTLGLKLFLMNPVDTRYDLLGHSDAGGKYHFTPISEFAKFDGKCLLLVDELDRFHPRALTALNALLANGKGIFPDLGMVEIDESTHSIVSTANTWGMGATAEYCGALKQDAAVLNRHPRRIPWDYDAVFEWELMKAHMPKHPEDVVKVDFAACIKVRENLAEHGIRVNWTPRDTMAVAIDRASGDSLKKAMEYSVLASLTEGQRNKVLAGVKA
jgi:MoxR-like ATPase